MDEVQRDVPQFGEWDAASPVERALTLAASDASGELLYETDEPVVFLDWLLTQYPAVVQAMRLELATWSIAGDLN